MSAYNIFQSIAMQPLFGDGGAPKPIRLRQEQVDAVRRAKAMFGSNHGGEYQTDKTSKKFLWNAKMRFGKTLCAMQLIREMQVRRVLIVTHRPVVNNEWFDNYKKIFNRPEDRGHYDYGTKSDKDNKGNYYDLEEWVSCESEDRHYIFFASMQYLRRSRNINETGDDTQLKADILKTDWDLVIIDEAHEGTRTALGQKVIDALHKSRTKMLHLSGTPFNLYEDFAKNEIFTWDYIQEQQAKRTWNEKHSGEENPYACLPQMKILTFNLGRLIDGFIEEGGMFKFSEFFRTWTGNPKSDRLPMPEGMKGRFVHEETVLQFLDKLCEESPTSNYPFSKEVYQNTFNHTLWVVPGVKEAKALENLLKSHDTFKYFDVINVAGNSSDDEQRDDALDRVKNAIGASPENTYTITISCGRLTTGVTIPEWTAVFYMKGSEQTSAATYMQTIFRVQGPATIDGKMKTECYVFDFAPDRSLKMVAETARFSSLAKSKSEKTKDEDDEGETTDTGKQTMRQFIDLCPVISMDGGVMTPYDVDTIYKQLENVFIERLVRKGFDDPCLYNQEELNRIDPDMLNHIGEHGGKAPDEHRKDATPVVDLSHMTPEQRRKWEENVRKKKAEARRKAEEKARRDAEFAERWKNMTEEEREAWLQAEAEKEARREKRKEEREEFKKRITNIRGIALRIPLLMYGGADAGDTTENITVDNFTRKIKDESWAEFMPKGLTKEDFNKIRKSFNATRFEEAGKRYRALTREADSLHVDDRIQQITEIFSYFRNPDKETVLTPWRVVNMHMSDTLGGYCFWNERFDGPNEKWLDHPTNGQLFESVPTHEPRYVDRGEVTQEVFGAFDNSRVLEINSKTGLYPLYVAYQYYRTRLQDYITAKCVAPDTISVEEEQVIWDDVLQHNVFVICNTPMAKLITRRTLCGFRKVEKVNIKNDNLIKRAIEDQEALVADIKRLGYWRGTTSKEDMKFNAVVGNPPYQEEGLNTRKAPIYHKFYDIAFEAADKVTLISPARFLYRAGQTPKEWMDKILEDHNIKIVKFFQKSSDVFPSVDIKGGVVITYRDTQKNFGKIGVFSEYNELRSILSKVYSHPCFKKNEFADTVSSQGIYKFTDKAFEHYPIIEDVQGKGTAAKITSKAFENIPELFFDEKPLDGEEYIQLMGRANNKRSYKWIKREYVQPVDSLDYHKVFVPEANGTGAIGEVLSTPIIGLPIIGLPIIGHTDTFLSIGRFEKSSDARNCLLYVQTKFARTMLGTLKATQHNPKNTWAYVPLQDFTSASDIDWRQSVADIDRQLYRKYGLTDEEIDFIERMIKPME